MRAAGFLLAGGQSRRMGRDKALLPFHGRPLAAHLADVLAQVASPVTLLGPAERYAALGLPVLEDRRPDCGPLAGLETALAATGQDWNLFVACDMPHVTPEALQNLLVAATGNDAAVARSADGRIHPLLAVYHRKLLPRVTNLLDQGERRVRALLEGRAVAEVPLDVAGNANTPQEWADLVRQA